MVASTRPDPIGTLAELVPGLMEGSGPDGGALVGNQHVVTVPLGPQTFGNATNYTAALFVAPVAGCYLKRVYLYCRVRPTDNSGDSEVNVIRRNVSGSADVQQLAAADFQPDDAMTNLVPYKLALTTTRQNRVAAAGDIWHITWTGPTTYTTPPQDVAVTAVFIVPSVDAD